MGHAGFIANGKPKEQLKLYERILKEGLSVRGGRICEKRRVDEAKKDRRLRSRCCPKNIIC
jgi:hypothetical protein